MEFSEAEKIIAEFFIEREGEGIVDELKTINLTKEGIKGVELDKLMEGKEIRFNDLPKFFSKNKVGKNYMCNVVKYS